MRIEQGCVAYIMKSNGKCSKYEPGGYFKNWTVPGYAHTPFPPKFLTGFCSDGPSDPGNVLAKFEVCSFTCSWDKSD